MRRPSSRVHRRALVTVAIIVVLVLVQLMIVSLVLSGGRDQELTIHRLETVQAFYAAESGLEMGIREVILAADEDGDCTIGTISHDGNDSNNPAFGNASWLVAAATTGNQTTFTSYGTAGSSRRQIAVVIDVNAGASFSDDFEDGTITGWTSLVEPMEESGGTFHTPSGSNTDCLYTIDDGTAWTDYTVSVDMHSIDNDVMGIAFRVQDVNNYYLFRQKFGDSGNWDLEVQAMVGGSPTVLQLIDNNGSSPGQVNDASQWYTFKVVVSGTNIKCYIDDVLKFDVTDSTYSSGTAGLWTWAETDSEFDNMLVE